jgi:8-oxo-dGTP pyrophosphatase MutT (NUDIX family)
VEQRLKKILSQRSKIPITNPSRIRAAVLVPLFRKGGQYYLMFLKRTDKVRVHKGQISFPGGTREARDGNLLQTALREASEEIGLAADDIQVLGELDDQESVSTNYVITPFLALIPHPYHFHADSHEVRELLEVPITALLDTRNQSQETTPDGRVVYFYHYGNEIIWGATARILKMLLEILTEVISGG